MNISSKDNVWSCFTGGKAIPTEDVPKDSEAILRKLAGELYWLRLHVFNFSQNYKAEWVSAGEDKQQAELFLEEFLSEDRSPIYTRIVEFREDELGIIISLEDKEDMDSVLEMEIRKDFPGAKTGKVMYTNELEDITNECYEQEYP